MASSLAALGLWMNALALMWNGEEPGYLVLRGRAMTSQDVAKALGRNALQVTKLLAELEMNGVFSRDHRGAIFSRRMVRDLARHHRARTDGSKGGNPTLRRGSSGDASPVTRPVTPHTSVDISSQFNEITSRRVNLTLNLERESDGVQTPAGSRAPRGAQVSAAVVPERPVQAAFWSAGLSFMRALFPGLAEDQTRRFLGKLLKEARNRHAEVLAKLELALDKRPVNPSAWLLQACREASGNGSSKPDARDWRDGYARDEYPHLATATSGPIIDGEMDT